MKTGIAQKASHISFIIQHPWPAFIRTLLNLILFSPAAPLSTPFSEDKKNYPLSTCHWPEQLAAPAGYVPSLLKLGPSRNSVSDTSWSRGQSLAGIGKEATICPRGRVHTACRRL